MEREILDVLKAMDEGKITFIEAHQKICDIKKQSEPSSKYELERLYRWITNPHREPSQTKFTAGITRNIAKEFEFQISTSNTNNIKIPENEIDFHIAYIKTVLDTIRGVRNNTLGEVRLLYNPVCDALDLMDNKLIQLRVKHHGKQTP